MASDGAKKLGIIIAGGMPPPGKLKRGMADDGADPANAGPDESDDAGDGPSALGDVWDALKAGDKAGAWDAFCDAVDMCANRDKSEPDKGEGDSGSDKPYA